jgi:hypothetical protein
MLSYGLRKLMTVISDLQFVHVAMIIQQLTVHQGTHHCDLTRERGPRQPSLPAYLAMASLVLGSTPRPQMMRGGREQSSVAPRQRERIRFWSSRDPS